MEAQGTDTPEPMGPPSDDYEALLAKRARRRRLALATGAGIVVAVGAGVYALLSYQERQHAERMSTALGKLEACLVGPPLAGDERASVRVRRIQLRAMALPEDALGADPWPRRCGTFAHQVDEEVRSAKKAESLGKAAAALAKTLRDTPALSGDLTTDVDAVFGAAATEKVAARAPADADPPPELASPLDADELGRGTPISPRAFSFATIFNEPHAAADLRLLVDDPKSPDGSFLCTVRRSSPEARCAVLPKAITSTKQGLRLLATTADGAEPLVFAGNRGAEGVFRADTGERIESLYSYGGSSWVDGFSTVLGWKEAEKELVATRKAPGAPATQTKLDPPFRIGNAYYSAQMLWDDVLLRGVTEAEERRLFALPLQRDGEVLGAPVDVGELPEPGRIEGGRDEPPHITGCKTADAVVVRVKGYSNDFLTFRLGGKWTSPLSPGLSGGTLSCSKSQAAITRVDSSTQAYSTSVRHVACTTAGCRQSTHVFKQLLGERYADLSPRDGHVDAVDLDGQVVLAWAAGERGGVRVRVAAPEALAKAPDQVVFDDLRKEGAMTNLSTFFDLKLVSREGFAVLLLSTVTGVHALRIEPNGKVSPMVVVRK
jgi:hypothetical protein